MKKISIKQKVSSLAVRISLVSIVIIGMITISGLLLLRSNMAKVSGQLGDTAANDSQTALEGRMIERLMTLATNRAALSDKMMREIQNSTEMIAYYATELIQNPEKYLQNPVASPDADNKGIMTTQFLRAEGSEFNDIEDESGLMGNIENLLLNIIENNINATTNYVGSEKGYIIIADDVSDKKTDFFDPRERPWYQLAKENGVLSWTDIYADAYGRGSAITCAKPYYRKDGSLAGIAGVGMVLTDITEIVAGTKIGETGYAFMMNEHGEIIISEKGTLDEANGMNRVDLLNSDNPELAALALNMINQKDGVERVTMDGKEYFIAYSALETLPWSLAAVIEIDEAIAPAVQLNERIIDMKNAALSDINVIIAVVITLFIVVFLTIMLIISYLSRKFANTLTNPITVLKDGVHRISNGNLEHVINIHTGDEIEDLGLSVNKMAIDLKDYINNLQKVTAEKERIGAELNVATRIQASMLPSIFPAFPNRNEFDIYAKMIPAKEVGGDFYDFFLIDETHMCVVIADVSGKGIPAALFMVIAKTLIKNSAQYGNSPAEIFNTVNNQLCEGNDAGMFVTAFAGILEIATGKFIYANAGHNPPLIKKSGGMVEWLKSKPGFVLAGMENISYREYETQLFEGDMLFLYTDGVTEAANNDSELFANDRLESCLNKYESTVPKDIVISIKNELDAFADGAEQADDITMLTLKIKRLTGTDGFKELTIPALLENMGKVLEFITGSYEIDAKTRIQIDTAVEEIFVNIVHYAYAPETGLAYIRVKNENNVLFMELSDDGKPFNPLEKPDPDITLTAEERKIGGLGIYMVKKTMDEVLYRRENGKNILTIKKELRS